MRPPKNPTPLTDPQAEALRAVIGGSVHLVTCNDMRSSRSRDAVLYGTGRPRLVNREYDGLIRHRFIKDGPVPKMRWASRDVEPTQEGRDALAAYDAWTASRAQTSIV